MPKLPQYRMQVLFEMREKAKVAAEEAYAEKKQIVIKEQKKLDEMRETLKQMVAMRQARKAEYAEKMRRGEVNISQIQANDRHIDKLKTQEHAYQIEIQHQQETLAEAERVAEEFMQEMIRATQDFKALEKHKEKWLKLAKREAMLKEEDMVEDIAQAQYFARLLENMQD